MLRYQNVDPTTNLWISRPWNIELSLLFYGCFGELCSGRRLWYVGWSAKGCQALWVGIGNPTAFARLATTGLSNKSLQAGNYSVESDRLVSSYDNKEDENTDRRAKINPLESGGEPSLNPLRGAIYRWGPDFNPRSKGTAAPAASTIETKTEMPKTTLCRSGKPSQSVK